MSGDKKLRAMTFMPYERPWSNVELIKDSGLIPYLLAKIYGFDVYMIGLAPEGVTPGLYNHDNADSIISAYPYFSYIKDINLLLVADYTAERQIQLLSELSINCDLLILRGFYRSNMDKARLYKSLNPTGKIYCGLDANSTWADRITWNDPEILQFFKDVDVFATSCTATALWLSRKWPVHVYTITNGNYDFLNIFQKFIPYRNRENVILTVGRLGTWQKATEILVDAFVRIANDIPDWTLELVGSETQEFKTYLQKTCKDHPEIHGRILEKGIISDRNILYQDYLKAKIFAFPSRLEGGAPNAVADALRAGLAIAVTEFDAYEDILNLGTPNVCGISSPIDDIDRFSKNLLTLCNDKNLEETGKNAFQNARNRYDMEKNVEKLYQLLFGDKEEKDKILENDKREEDEFVKSEWKNIMPGFNRPIRNFSRVSFQTSEESTSTVDKLYQKNVTLMKLLYQNDSTKVKAFQGIFLLMVGIMSHFSGASPIRIVEFGAGDGKLSAIISEILYAYHPDNSFTVITNLLGDGSQDMWAENFVKAEIPTGISYLSGDFRDTNFASDHFDFVIINGELVYEDIEAVFHEACRILRTPGYLMFIPSKEQVKQNEILRKLIENVGGETFQFKSENYASVWACSENYCKR